MNALKFMILRAVVKTIADGRLNAGNKYVEVEVMEDSMFAEQSHIKTYFVPQNRIPAWEKCIADGVYPPVFYKYELVETAPYRAKKGDTVYPTEHTSMKLLIRTDPAGNPLEDANAMAEEILNSNTMCVRVAQSQAPLTITAPQPVNVVSEAFNPANMTPEQAAFLASLNGGTPLPV